MKRIRSIRNRIILVSVALSLLAECAMLAGGVVSLDRLYSDGSEREAADGFEYVGKQANMLFDGMYFLNNILLEPELSRFIQDNWAIRDAESALAAQKRLNDEMNELADSRGLVKRILLLGDNSNQKCFGKNLDETGWIEDLPNYDDLEAYGIDLLLSQGLERPRHLEPNSVMSRIEEYAGRPKAIHAGLGARERVERLAALIEGKDVIYNNFNRRAALIVFDCGDLRQVLGMDRVDGARISLYSRQSMPLHEDLPILDDLIRHQGDEFTGEWSSQVAGIPYVHRFLRLDHFDLTLVYSLPASRASRVRFGDIVDMVAISMTMLLLAAILSINLTRWLTRPFLRFTGMIHSRTTDQLLEELPSMEKRPLDSRLSLQTRTLLVMALTILVPLLGSGAYITNRIGYLSTRYVEETNLRITEEIVSSVGELVSRYRLVSHYVDNDTAAAYIRNRQTSSDRLEVLAALREPIDLNIARLISKVSDFTGFLFFSIGGQPVYISNYPVNSDVFQDASSRDLGIAADRMQSDFLSQEDRLFWQQVPGAVRGKSDLALVKTIYDTKEGEGVLPVVVGYFAMVAGQLPFRDIPFTKTADFVILDDTGRPLICSTAQNETMLRDTAANLFREQQDRKDDPLDIEIQRSRYQVFLAQVPGTAWDLVVYHDMLDTDARIDSVLTGNFYIVVILALLLTAVATLLSQRLTTPLRNLEENMTLIGRGIFSSPMRYKSGNEIGELVEAYNQMIQRINALVEDNRKQMLQEQDLRASYATARLNELQQQINPHFLYNALEMISMESSRNGDPRPARMAKALAGMFRYNLGRPDPVVPLYEELEHARTYLEIQELRFQGRFSTIWEIPEDTQDLEVVRLILQPILENCILHGFADLMSGGLITIRTSIDQDRLCISVEDNGCGMEPDRLEAIRKGLGQAIGEASPVADGFASGSGSGIALVNVNQRIRLVCGPSANLSIESRHLEWTRVSIDLPAKAVRSR